MTEFRPITIADREWMEPLFRAEDSRSADFNFGNTYMWDVSYMQTAARICDRVVIRPQYSSECFYAFPVGGGELKPVVDELVSLSCPVNSPLTLRGVEERHRRQLELLYPGRFSFTEDRDHFDYIYSAEKLANLTGKKLHGKRNHINRFLAEQSDWRFRPLTPELIPDCAALLEQWAPHSAENVDEELSQEHEAILRGFRNFEELHLLGGTLFAGGRMVAFTVGERISGDTVNVHFEKAFADVNGAYPMINREFVRYLLELMPEIRFINREDDAGLDSLRQAKLSYAPEYLLVKYTARWL